LRNALKDANLETSAVDYINAHGTPRPLGDVAETRAVKRLLARAQEGRRELHQVDDRAPARRGRAASEAVLSVLALRDQVSPPTINLRTHPGPECDLDYVPNAARKMPIRVALSNSFGFGGTNGTLVFARP